MRLMIHDLNESFHMPIELEVKWWAANLCNSASTVRVVELVRIGLYSGVCDQLAWERVLNEDLKHQHHQQQQCCLHNREMHHDYRCYLWPP